MIYLYIMCCSDRTNFHVGYSNDIINAVEFYRSMPALDKDKIPYLVYLEGYTNTGEAKDRFKFVFGLPVESKIEIVKGVNPDFIEMIPGVNIEI